MHLRVVNGLGVFTHNIDYTTLALVESWVVESGLELAWSKGIWNLMLGADSMIPFQASESRREGAGWNTSLIHMDRGIIL